MNTPHPDHEELRQRFLTGELSREEVLAAAGEDAELVAQLDQFAALDDTLGSALRHESEVLSRAEEISFPAGEAATREFLARNLPPASRPRQSWSYLAVAIAAAAVVMLGLWAAGVFEEEPVEPGPGTILSPNQYALVTPTELEDAWTVFTYIALADVPPGGRVEFVIFADASDPEDKAILRSGTLEGTTWTPTPEELAKLPARIYVELRAYDGSGQEVDRQSRSCSLRR